MKRTILAVASVTLTVAQYLALAAFACAVVLAAWRPALDRTWVVGGSSVSVRVTEHHLATAIAHLVERARDPSPALLPVTRFLPAGIELDHSASGTAYFALRLPYSVGVGATGALWLSLLLANTRRPRSRGVKTEHVARGVGRNKNPAVFAGELACRVGYVWAVRWATGAAALAAAWFCVYALPRDTAVGMAYTDAQALHVAGAACAVLASTILIAFD